MAKEIKNPVSRRKAAALKFLSNITLDGSFNSHQLESQITCEERQPLGSSHTDSVLTSNLNKQNSSRDEIIFSTSYVELESSTCHVTSRERTNTGSSDYSKCGELKYKRFHRPSVIEDASQFRYFSSTESVSFGAFAGRHRTESNDYRQKGKDIVMVNSDRLFHCRSQRIILLSTGGKTPLYTFSILPYKKAHKIQSKEGRKDGITRKRNLSGSRPLSSFIDSLDPFVLLGLDKNNDEKMISYSQLLTPSKKANPKTLIESTSNKAHPLTKSTSEDIEVKNFYTASHSPSLQELKGGDLDNPAGTNTGQYSPYLLDDPELMSGKHRTVLTFFSYRASIIDYVRPADLKKEVNEKFKDRFPQIQLTLTKLRSLKKDMRKISKHESGIDLLTVAQAYVYFEKILLKNIINKTNRKLCAAVSLILSAKMNDVKGAALKALFERLESVFRLSRKDMLAVEFPVLVALEFGLHVPTGEVLPHYQRLVCES